MRDERVRRRDEPTTRSADEGVSSKTFRARTQGTEVPGARARARRKSNTAILPIGLGLGFGLGFENTP